MVSEVLFQKERNYEQAEIRPSHIKSGNSNSPVYFYGKQAGPLSTSILKSVPRTYLFFLK